MIRGLYQNSASMQILIDKMDVIANNLANSSTNGYKKRGVFLDQLISADQALERNNLKIRRYKKGDFTVNACCPQKAFRKPNLGDIDIIRKRRCCINKGNPKKHIGQIATYTDYSSGGLRETGNPLDVAVSGDGFFSIQTPDGVGYTRDGQFNLDNNGNLVTADGDFVMGESGPIQLNGNHIEISNAGEIVVDGSIVNKFVLRDFDENSLIRVKKSLFVPSGDNAQTKESNATIKQGYLEISNVQVVKEMVDMIAAHRHYDANSKVIQTIDTTLRKTSNDIGK